MFSVGERISSNSRASIEPFSGINNIETEIGLEEARLDYQQAQAELRQLLRSGSSAADRNSVRKVLTSRRFSITDILIRDNSRLNQDPIGLNAALDFFLDMRESDFLERELAPAERGYVIIEPLRNSAQASYQILVPPAYSSREQEPSIPLLVPVDQTGYIDRSEVEDIVANLSDPVHGARNASWLIQEGVIVLPDLDGPDVQDWRQLYCGTQAPDASTPPPIRSLLQDQDLIRVGPFEQLILQFELEYTALSEARLDLRTTLARVNPSNDNSDQQLRQELTLVQKRVFQTFSKLLESMISYRSELERDEIEVGQQYLLGLEISRLQIIENAYRRAEANLNDYQLQEDMLSLFSNLQRLRNQAVEARGFYGFLPHLLDQDLQASAEYLTSLILTNRDSALLAQNFELVANVCFQVRENRIVLPADLDQEIENHLREILNPGRQGIDQEALRVLRHAVREHLRGWSQVSSRHIRLVAQDVLQQALRNQETSEFRALRQFNTERDWSDLRNRRGLFEGRYIYRR